MDENDEDRSSESHTEYEKSDKSDEYKPDEYMYHTDFGELYESNEDKSSESQTEYEKSDKSDEYKPDEYMYHTDFGELDESNENRPNGSQTDLGDLHNISDEKSYESNNSDKIEETDKNKESDKIEETGRNEVSDISNSEGNIENDINIESNNEKAEESYRNDEFDKSYEIKESNDINKTDNNDNPEKFEEGIKNAENFNLDNSTNNNGILFKKNLFNNIPIIDENISKFSSEFFFNNYNKIYIEELPKKDELIVNIKEDIINGNLNSSLTELLKGKKEDLLVELDDISYQITTTANQKNGTYNNISIINLGDCEAILREKYGIKEDLSLIILKIEYKMKGLLIPVIGYEVYHPLNYTQLDLNYCNNTLVTLNIPVTIDENNTFKHDPNSDYYNDECYAYTTENGTDIILNDRKKEFEENNLSLCENNCTFNGYDPNTKKALCECETKIKINLISEIIKIIEILI